MFGPIPNALQEWWKHKGDPVPTRFNRHATAHAADEAVQHSRVNAAVAIMLVSSLLREAEESAW